MKLLTSSLLFFMISCGPGMTALKFQEHMRDGATISHEDDSFSSIKTNILEPHCLKCHSNLASEEALMKWISPGRPEESRFFLVVQNGSMPKNSSPLGTEKLELIRDYITGLKPVSFDQLKEEVLEKGSCLRCHKSMEHEESLARWIDASAPENSKLYLRVKDGTMPKGGPPLSAEQERLILSYIKGLKP